MSKHNHASTHFREWSQDIETKVQRMNPTSQSGVCVDSQPPRKRWLEILIIASTVLLFTGL